MGGDSVVNFLGAARTHAASVLAAKRIVERMIIVVKGEKSVEVEG